MATYTGQFGGVRSGTVNVAEVRNFEIDTQGDTVEDTSMGDIWKTHKHTHKSWTASLECWYDHTDTTGQGAFAIGAAVSGEFYPTQLPPTATQTAPRLTGTAVVTGRVVKSSHDGLVELSLSLQGTGPLVETPA